MSGKEYPFSTDETIEAIDLLGDSCDRLRRMARRDKTEGRPFSRLIHLRLAWSIRQFMWRIVEARPE